MRKGSRAATALLALCCTAVAGLTGCGGAARDGYVAVGAAAPGPERGAGENVAPQGHVEFQQLGGPSAAGGSSASSGTPSGTSTDASTGTSAGTSAQAPGSGLPGGSTPGGATATASGGPGGTPGTPAGPGRTPPAAGTPNAPGTPSTSPTGPGGPSTKPGTTPPAPPTTPAKLTLSTPTRAAAADRWCERVTVTFTNTGTTAARAGTVSFATHIIGALGIDWATITTTQPLPSPLAGGASKTQTYTVCVEAWRVPLGMHVDTRNVTATWS
ncbi:hypothetical protein ABT234_04935 [Streptomyces sp. NPDC001586]|uniref:hypothetical protein n=1 Tax=Streptomyces sp. NPDC001586 TaxID=3154387 RepID=UPI00332B77A4